jgi:hypothetical protein
VSRGFDFTAPLKDDAGVRAFRAGPFLRITPDRPNDEFREPK